MWHWIAEYRSWRGRARDLAELAAAVEGRLRLAPMDVVPNERLVRHYVHCQILDRPERSGREALFGYRQLYQFLAARILIRRGWSIAATAQRTQKITEIEAMLMMQEAERAPRTSSTTSMKALLLSRLAPTMHGEHVCALSNEDEPIEKRRFEHLSASALSPEGKPSPSGRRFLYLEAAPWCRLYVDRNVLARQSSESVAMVVRLMGSMLEREHRKVRPNL